MEKENLKPQNQEQEKEINICEWMTWETQDSKGLLLEDLTATAFLVEPGLTRRKE